MNQSTFRYTETYAINETQGHYFLQMYRHITFSPCRLCLGQTTNTLICTFSPSVQFRSLLVCYCQLMKQKVAHISWSCSFTGMLIGCFHQTKSGTANVLCIPNFMCYVDINIINATTDMRPWPCSLICLRLLIWRACVLRTSRKCCICLFC